MIIEIPETKADEIYAGTIINPDGTGHHVILLDGENDDNTWYDSMAWAQSIGGDLLDRIEQSLLFIHLKDRVKKEWYWSKTQHAADSGYAWYQDFNNGCQYIYFKGIMLRARAVRRVYF